MAKLNKKKIEERADKMENGWEVEAPTVEFKKHSLAELKAIRLEIATEKQASADFKAQAKLKDDRVDQLYGELDDMMVEVGESVGGHDDYGKDSLLYGLMGFIRKSLRSSGLTRKNKNNSEPEIK